MRLRNQKEIITKIIKEIEGIDSVPDEMYESYIHFILEDKTYCSLAECLEPRCGSENFTCNQCSSEFKKKHKLTII